VRRPRSQAHRRRASRARTTGAPLLLGLGLAVAAIVLIGPVGGLAGGPGAPRPVGGDRPTAGRLTPGMPLGRANGPAAPEASSPTGTDDLPACRFDDVPATQRPAGAWTLTILDTIYRMPAGYAPPDLVAVANAGISGGGQVRATMIPDLKALAKAARSAGLPLAVKSAYRSEARQQAVYDDWVRTSGETAARQFSARPGHSEHQLGLAVDFAAEGGTAPWDESFEQTAQGHWLAEHAADYGFVMSYPRGAEPVTCYAYEPWHFRWVGRTVARAVAASRKPLREWLWSGQDATP
jgi:zinc D-Ala-D-Ala carboxypeptidase